MTTYFTYDLDAKEALAAIEEGNSLPSEKVDNTDFVKSVETYGAFNVGNRAELLIRLIDYARAKNDTYVFKQENKRVFDEQKSRQAMERGTRRLARTALLQAVVSENMVHPTDIDSDKRDNTLPPMASFEGQKRVFYDKAEALSWCMENMPNLITVDWSAFDSIMAKNNGFRATDGTPLLEEYKVPPPVTVARVAREIISTADISELPTKTGEIEFGDSHEQDKFFEDVTAHFTQDDIYSFEEAVRWVSIWLPQYENDFVEWHIPFYKENKDDKESK